jgi:F0F1-type ATP synthase assembly protein I
VKDKKSEPEHKSTKQWLKSSGLAIQMVATILVFVWIGNYLDDHMNNKYPLFTLGLGVAAIILVLYKLITDMSK